jgi:hypothetical protein
VACPFFLPIKRWEEGGWLHASRLPLGGGWTGYCSAPGHEGTTPGGEEMRELCNMGYATSCQRLPVERAYDAVRFSVARERGKELSLQFVCEAGHRPVQHGTLDYDSHLGQWISSHADARIQKMAECYVESYLARRSSTSTNL